MKYGDIHDESINEPHDLSDQCDLTDQFNIATAVDINNMPFLIAQIAIDLGFSPLEFIDFMRGNTHV